MIIERGNHEVLQTPGSNKPNELKDDEIYYLWLFGNRLIGTFQLVVWLRRVHKGAKV